MPTPCTTLPSVILNAVKDLKKVAMDNAEYHHQL